MTTAPPARISLNYLAATCVLLAAGSAARAEKPSAEQLAFFESKIRPVLSARCYSCHSEKAKTDNLSFEAPSRLCGRCRAIQDMGARRRQNQRSIEQPGRAKDDCLAAHCARIPD